MGGEHDRTDAGVIVPSGAGTDGIRVPLEEVSDQSGRRPIEAVMRNDLTYCNPPIFSKQTEGLLSAAVQPPGSGSHLAPSHSSHHLTSSHSREHLSSETLNPSVGNDSLTTEHTLDTEQLDGSVASSEANAQTGGAAYTQDEVMVFDEESDEDRLIAQGGIGIPTGPVCSPRTSLLIILASLVLICWSLIQDGRPAPLLPPIAPEHQGRKCLVLDLDETLLHSSFKVCLRNRDTLPGYSC
jgi:RNA polymerase II subunit A small phosphatase-like protein